MPNLTDREAQFVANFVELGGNGSEAARRVGFTNASCRVRASELLKRQEIKAAVSAAVTERLEAW